MEKVIDILKQIANTSSRNDKEAILKSNEDNALLKEILFRVYNPFIVYGIGKKKLDKFLKTETANSEFNDILDILDYLEENNTGSDIDSSKVARFVNSQKPDHKKIVTEIILKTLKIGVTSNTINKVYGRGFIPEFKVQLAKKYEDEVHKIEGKEFILTEKLDGMRILIRVEDGIVKAFSRSGQPVLGLVDVFEEASDLLNGFYDGELLIVNADDYKDRDVLQETLKITRKDGDKKNIIMHVFDYITLEEFENGKTKEGYKARRKFIESAIPKDCKWIKVLPVLYEGSDLTVIPKILTELEKDGKEGLMLNTSDGKWENKRTDNLLKVKSFSTADLLVIDLEEGTGKFEGMLGNLVLDYKGYRLGCGSGLSDHDRVEVWNNKEKYIGKVVEISYFRESKSKDGNLSVSFPVFKMWRDDKTAKDVSYF